MCDLPVCVPRVCLVPREARRGVVECPETGVTGSCELSVWELEPGPLEELPVGAVLLTAEPSLGPTTTPTSLNFLMK